MPFQSLEVDLVDNGDEIRSYLAEKTNQRTVPSIFINHEFIGGNDALQAKHASGELAKLLGL